MLHSDIVRFCKNKSNHSWRGYRFISVAEPLPNMYRALGLISTLKRISPLLSFLESDILRSQHRSRSLAEHPFLVNIYLRYLPHWPMNLNLCVLLSFGVSSYRSRKAVEVEAAPRAIQPQTFGLPSSFRSLVTVLLIT